MNRIPQKARALLYRGQLNQDLEDELRFHLEMEAEATGNPEASLRSLAFRPRSEVFATCGRCFARILAQ